VRKARWWDLGVRGGGKSGEGRTCRILGLKDLDLDFEREREREKEGKN